MDGWMCRLEGVTVARWRSVILAAWVADFRKVGIDKLEASE